MHKARAFFFVCAGIFLLALTYHLGARSAGAQAGAQIGGFAVASGYLYVMTATGDVYARYNTTPLGPLVPMGNYWTGSEPTSVTPISIGQLKAKYAK